MGASATGGLATGTYNKHIGLYDSESGEQITLMENTHRGGITQLKFIQEIFYIHRKSIEIPSRKH